MMVGWWTLAVLLFVGNTIARPNNVTLDVPYHRQFTDFSCGDASLKMVLDYYGKFSMNQFNIMNVMRTTSDEGTLSLDIVRGAHFSQLSMSVGTLNPEYELKHGYPDRPFGLSALWHDDTKPWTENVKDLIAQGIPVLTLMHYYVNGTVPDDGHFRVVIGYDDISDTIILNDPWDRDGNPQVLELSTEEFESAWNYIEHNTPRVNPYFGVAIFNWNLVVQAQGQNVKATVTYPCPAPFDCSQSPASNVMITLESTQTIAFANGVSQTWNVGSLNAGQTATASWSLTGNTSGAPVKVHAKGIIQNEMPWTYKSPSENYPPYAYFDVVGSNPVTLTL